MWDTLYNATFFVESVVPDLVDPMAIKRLGDDPNALKNGNAIHGLSLLPVEEMDFSRFFSGQRSMVNDGSDRL
jgi:hypothetical protein